MTYDVLVIGGGASGMATAIMTARYGLSVAVIESNDRVLKKVLATGNGKCNFSNATVSADRYNTPFVRDVLSDFDYEAAVAFFESLGMMCTRDDERAYPYSRQASTVVHALMSGASALGVELITGENVTAIEAGYNVTADRSVYHAKCVVLATGSNATSGRMSHALVGHFGHNYGICTPSLTYLMCDRETVAGLQGIRIKASAYIMVGGKRVVRSGELLFKKDAISGIMVFELSSYFARRVTDNNVVTIDMAPDIDRDALHAFLNRSDGSTLDALIGVLPKQLAILIDRLAHGNIDRAVELIKGYKVAVRDVGDIKNAQVVSGGLDTRDFDSRTLESRLAPDLYATGEVLDVDGECGGFNLHWAWSSAHAVAQNIGEKYGKK